MECERCIRFLWVLFQRRRLAVNSTELVSRGEVIPESGGVWIIAVLRLICNVEFLLIILIGNNLEWRGFTLFYCRGESTSQAFLQIDSFPRFHIMGCNVVRSNCVVGNKDSVITLYIQYIHTYVHRYVCIHCIF